MTLFSKARAKRNTAFVVLFAWVFALASGVVNACFLQERGTLHHVAVVSTSHNGSSASLAAGRVGAMADQDDGADFSKVPCLKVCVDGSQSLIKQQSTFDPTDLGLALLVTTISAAPPVLLASRGVDALQPPPAERPLRYRYSRLTL
jgi:hypothetical protein